MKQVKNIFFTAMACCMVTASVMGQTADAEGTGVQNSGKVIPITLEQAIYDAQNQSISAMTARYTFMSAYWSFRSYRASRLPSLNLTGSALNFDRSLRLLQDYDTGDMRYIENYNLQNTVGLSVRQNIGFTGGTLSLYSSLNRLDQFGDKNIKSYYSQPITLSYTQPLFAYNRFKWEKKIEPKEYELAKRKYIEAMEDITLQAVNYFFNLALSRANYDIAVKNYANTRVRERQMQLNSFLRLDENAQVDPMLDEEIPLVNIDYDMALDKALENSSFRLTNEIKALNAEAGVAQAKADRGASASINARFGLSQTGDTFRTAYSGLLDQEVVGLEFSIPIFDWGMGKGRVKMAKANAEMVRSQIEQEEIDYRRQIYTLIEQFANQRNQCYMARRARQVANDRYEIAMDNFRRGTISVTEMNTAQSEKDAANQTYISELASFWLSYYELRRQTLYDFISGTDIIAEFDKIISE